MLHCFARWLAGWLGTRRFQEAANVDIFKVLAIFFARPSFNFQKCCIFCWLGWRWAGWLAGLAGWLAGWLAGRPGSIRIQEEANVDIFKVLATFLKIE